MTDRTAQITAFLDAAGWASATRSLVAGDASNRRYDRLRRPDGTAAILMDAPPAKGEDVVPFIQIAEHLRASGLSAPTIYHRDIANGFLIIEDFGDALFADLMARDPAQQGQLYRAATDVLIHLQTAPEIDLPLCDTTWLTGMMAPLFEWYAPDTSALDVTQFQDLFRPLAERATPNDPVLILRDYHAQNLLLLPDVRGVKRVGILDFQDAMRGHPAYDLVSILQDARRDVGLDIEAETIDYMMSHGTTDPAMFKSAYAILGLQRNLRILGIFARLCIRDGKAHYVDFIPRVWGYILRNLAHPDLVQLRTCLLRILPNPTDTYLEHLKSQCPHKPSPQ